MNWDKALSLELVVPQMSCSLIIVGESKEGLPFCYENSFTLQKVDSEQWVVSLEFQALNPLENLHRVGFIEVSFRERGILYYAFVDLVQLSTDSRVCTMTLSTPPELSTFQNRRFNRIDLASPAPLICRIVGVHKSSTHQGIIFSGFIHDISAGGLSFVTQTRTFYPLFLELSFTLPDHPHTYIVNGEISRVSQIDSNTYRVAAEFRNMSETITHLIDDYCSRQT
jgi:c-di-GMP-binding flagellar brake protein YcgR